MSTTAAQEAMERARRIAAKFAASGDSNKRSNDSTDNDSNKKAKTEGLRRRFWIAVSSDRPASHFNSFLSSKLEDLQQESLEIYLDGKGSNRPRPPPGVPQEPLHVIITGPPHLVAAVEQQVQDYLQQAETAPLEGVEDETNTQALVDLSSNNNSSSYRPASVAQMIGLQPSLDGPTIQRDIQVPNGVVGFIIGRGGENITRMQATTSCKVQIQKEHDLAPGQVHRTITLIGPSEQALDQVQGIIDGMVAERVASFGGNNNSDPKVAAAVQQGHTLLSVPVPDADVGLVIGKQGATIRQIQETTGANIQVPQQGENGIRTLQVTHPTPQGAQQAQAMIDQLIASKRTNNSGPQTSVEVHIPDGDVGLCIGRQGSVIKHLQSTTNTRIQIPTQPVNGVRIATVTGSPEGCAQVQAMIQQISAEQSSAGVLSGAPPSAYRQHYNNNASGNQSAEWAAYHAAQAAVSASAAPAAQQQTTTQATTTSNEYHEQFFRYAYYYGEDAARAYYTTWSPPVGTPNPYGVNPNGITPAPAPASTTAAPAAAAPAPTPAPAAPTNAPRDTGRRMVSNLPAWMTAKK